MQYNAHRHLLPNELRPQKCHDIGSIQIRGDANLPVPAHAAAHKLFRSFPWLCLFTAKSPRF
jgi:hypothetical protein